MVTESKFLANSMGSEDFIEYVTTMRSLILVFLIVFGAVCFTIGSQCFPRISPTQKAKIKRLKVQITTLENKLAQRNEGGAGSGRFQYIPEEEEDVKKMKRTLQSRQKELKTASEKINALSAQNEHIRAKWQQIKTELAAAKEELRGARAYMSMEDEYSGAEVVKHVERLNASIMQTAANLAERFDVETMALDGSSLDNSNGVVVQRAEKTIGTQLMKLLRTCRNQLVLELAFQATMVLYTQEIASSWCFRSLGDEDLLEEIYLSMREDKLQGIFGRWRQLTRTHLQASKSALEPQLLPNLADKLVDIAVAAGHKEDDASSIRQIIMTNFSGALGEIIDLGKKLNSMIGEGVTSFDIDVVFVKPNTAYDPAQMVEADGSTTGDGREQVVCTTDLGLVGVKKTANSMNTSVMLKAKVVLPSMLAGIDDT